MSEVREMVIPLRAAWKVPRSRRANRAMAEIRKHVHRHMKVSDDEKIWIDEDVNHASGPGECRSHQGRFVLCAPGKKDSQLK